MFHQTRSGALVLSLTQTARRPMSIGLVLFSRSDVSLAQRVKTWRATGPNKVHVILMAAASIKLGLVMTRHTPTLLR